MAPDFGPNLPETLQNLLQGYGSPGARPLPEVCQGVAEHSDFVLWNFLNFLESAATRDGAVSF